MESICIGLSERNLELLKEGHPIYIKKENSKEAWDLDKSIVIVYGKTEQDIINDIEKNYHKHKGENPNGI